MRLTRARLNIGAPFGVSRSEPVPFVSRRKVFLLWNEGDVLTEKATIMDDKAMSRAVQRIAFEIVERNRGADDLCVVGVLRRGAVLADIIAGKIEEIEGKTVDVGYLDITKYRDDIKDKDEKPDLSDISFEIEGKKIIIVDDVLYTGRSARAAIDAIMSRGRPRLIQLAVLVDRGHRELPVRPDYIGKNVPTSASEKVKVEVIKYDGINRVAIYE